VNGLQRPRFSVRSRHSRQRLLERAGSIAEPLLRVCTAVPHTQRGDLRVVDGEPRLSAREPRAGFQQFCCTHQSRTWQRFTHIGCSNRPRLLAKGLSIREIRAGENIPLTGIPFIQGERERRRDVVDVCYGEPTCRMSGNLSRSQFEHRVSERVTEASRPIQHARVQDDNADAVAYRVQCLFLREPLGLVVQQP